MVHFIVGVFVLGVLYLAARFFVQANPSSMAKTLRQLVGILLLGVGIVLVFGGKLAFLALPVLLGGAAILFGEKFQFNRGGGAGRFGRADRFGRSHRKASTVKTAFFDMKLDHATGEMDGIVCAGGFDGQRLSDLEPAKLKVLYKEISNHASVDTDSLSLLETYLDSVMAGWREDFHVDGDTRHGSAARSGAISEEEAYEILGLARGADIADIRAAHRRLMLKLHPDRGGSTVLAAKINEAKDILLRKHSSNS